MKQLHASGEDYLEAILVLKRKKGVVRSIDVARYLGVSKPSVCHAVNTLKDGGFLVMDEDHFLRLTDIGRDVSEKTYEKHCFFTRLLVDAGVEPKTAEQDACRMEHAISDDSFQKIKSGLKEKEKAADPSRPLGVIERENCSYVRLCPPPPCGARLCVLMLRAVKCSGRVNHRVGLYGV